MSESVFARINTLNTSYFESQITLPTQWETLEILNDVKIWTYRISSQIEAARLSKTRGFIYKIKREAAKRYEQGDMNSYEIADFRQELGYLTHTMNEYFKNIETSERTNNQSIRALARQNLRDADRSYGRLSAITQKSTRK